MGPWDPHWDTFLHSGEFDREKRGSRMLSQKRDRKRVGLGTPSDSVRRVPVYTRAKFSLFREIAELLQNGSRKGGVLETFLRRQVAGGCPEVILQVFGGSSDYGAGFGVVWEGWKY